MNRRKFIAGLGGAAAWPLAARAQQGDRVRRVGVLWPQAEADPDRQSRIASLGLIPLLRQALKDLGWIEGRNLRLDFPFAPAGDLNRIRAEASELVRLAPDVIFLAGGAALNAGQQETKTIPIVFLGTGDPAETAVKNIARPEGNITGFANAFGSLGGKWLQLLKEAAPNVTRVAFLGGPRGITVYLPSVEAAGRALGVQVVAIPVQEFSDATSVKAAIETFAAEPNGGVLPGPGVLSFLQRELIQLTERHRLPMIGGARSFAANGALMSYDGDPYELVRGAASYVDRILRGAKVSDLPVQYPTKFRLVVNLKTAKAIGVEIPPTLLALADEVIQ
jgi:putative ABC transport system substrate-binding protein